MKITLADIAQLLGCAEPDKGITVPGKAQIDSRLVHSGDLFFCIRGERVDGHDFALSAAKAGAAGIVAERDPFAGMDFDGTARPPVFIVKDSVKALQKIAAAHRDSMNGRVIGVTGTAGKTSVKEVLAQVLAARGRTERNPLNKNNSIGLPMSLLNADEKAAFWVMEAGISRPGDMEELGEILRPDMALVLNVGEAHLEGLGKKGVAWHKSRLFNYVRENGAVFYSPDYPELEKAVTDMAADLRARNIGTSNFSAKKDDVYCRAEYKGVSDYGKGLYRIICGSAQFEASTPFHGEMGSENVAAIAALAMRAGLSPEEISNGLSTASLPEQRFAISQKGGYTIVDDSYNANPLSSRRMLEVTGGMAAKDKLPLILVMGEMGELGGSAAKAHQTLGGQMAAQNPAMIFWKGGHLEAVAAGLRMGGSTVIPEPVISTEEFIDKFTKQAPKSALVFFKGSRMNHLEELVNALTGSERQGKH